MRALPGFTGGTPATVLQWTANQINTSVPSGATPGDVVVTVNGVASNGYSFTVTEGSSSNIYYYIDDMLGSSRTIVQDGQTSACYEADFYPFGGERDVNVSCVQNYKFEGKERDGETQNDNFGARYYSNRFGRWLSADSSSVPTPVPYASLTNPQTLNLYAMVSDNPETFADLDGHYVFNTSGCGDNKKCQNKWDKAERKFEKRRQKNLNSKKAAVRAAAEAYGAPGQANGVFVGFANLTSQGIYGSVDPTGSALGGPLVQVTLDFGRAGSSDTATHEGTHVADDMRFLNSFNVFAGYDQALNITHGQTEFNAFKAGAEVSREHGFGPNDDQKIWNFLHSSPTYGPIINVPVFDPARFPAGPPLPGLPPPGATDDQ